MVIVSYRGTRREAEVILAKPVEGTDRELRLFRWKGDDQELKYAIEEVVAQGSSQALSFGDGMAVGEPKYHEYFERTFEVNAGKD